MGGQEWAMDTRAQQRDDDVHAQPGATTYVLVAAVLTVLTATEVAVFYIPALHGALVPILLTLSAGKFILVVLFYMHLKFDSRLFTGVFATPLVLAILVVITLIVLFKVLPVVDSSRLLSV